MTLMRATADAQKDLDYAVAAADEVQARALADAGRTFDYAIAAADETFNKADADGWGVFARAASGFHETLENALARAEADYLRAEAAAATAFTFLVTTAGVALQNAVFVAQSAAVSAVAAAAVARTQAVAAARGDALVAYHSGWDDMRQVADLYAAWEVDQAQAGAVRMVGEAAARTDYAALEGILWKASEDARAVADEAHVNRSVNAGLAWVAAAAAADRAYADAHADAEVAWAHEAAAAVRAYAEAEADAARDHAYAAATADRAADEAEADAAHAYEHAYWPRYLEWFTAETNASRDLAKSDATELAGFLKQAANADVWRETREMIARHGVISRAASADRDLAIAFGEKEAADLLLQACREVHYIECLPLEHFQSEVWTFTTVAHWLWNDGLDMATNFFSGWADRLTLGGTRWVRQNMYAQDFVDYGSGAYMGGSVVGSVHGFALGFGSASCGVGMAYTAARTYTTVSTVYGMVDAAPRILSGEATAWDYLAFMPAAGWLGGKMMGMGCFVAGTPVVVGWEELPAGAAFTGTSADDGWSGTWLVAGVLSLTAAVRLRRRRSLASRDFALESYFSGPVYDDLDDFGHGGRLAPRVEPYAAATSTDSSRRSAVDARAPARHSPSEAEISVMWPVAFPTDAHHAHVQPSTPRGRSGCEPRRRSPARGLVCTGLMLCGFLCIALSLPRSLWHAAVPPAVAADSRPSGPTEGRLLTYPINELRPGMRVLAENPEVHAALLDLDVDPETWRLVSLYLEKADGSGLEVELLRPLDWLALEALQLLERSPTPLQPLPLIAPASEAWLHHGTGRERPCHGRLDQSLPADRTAGPE